MAKKNRIPHKFLPWIAARKKWGLSDAHVQMARELGMDPARMRHRVKKNDPLRHLPLPELIETLYRQQFGRERPERILSVEAMAAEHLARREARKAAQVESDSAENGPKVSGS